MILKSAYQYIYISIYIIRCMYIIALMRLFFKFGDNYENEMRRNTKKIGINKYIYK